MNDGKAGSVLSLLYAILCPLTLSSSFVSAWQSSMRVHEMMAENRLRFAQRLNEMSEELSTLVKEVEKNRKQVALMILFAAIPRLTMNTRQRS